MSVASSLKFPSCESVGFYCYRLQYNILRLGRLTASLLVKPMRSNKHSRFLLCFQVLRVHVPSSFCRIKYVSLRFLLRGVKSTQPDSILLVTAVASPYTPLSFVKKLSNSQALAGSNEFAQHRHSFAVRHLFRVQPKLSTAGPEPRITVGRAWPESALNSIWPESRRLLCGLQHRLRNRCATYPPSRALLHGPA